MMAIKSKSDFYGFRVFIFDLDNTIYSEKDYLFQGYAAIARFLSGFPDTVNENVICYELKNTFIHEGRTELFNKTITKFNLDISLVKECVNILHTFNVHDKLKIYPAVKKLLTELLSAGKQIFILTNGNPVQQKNKVDNIDWGGLISHIQVLYADEIKPKPSSAGVEKILSMTGCETSEVIFLGDSDTDRLCAGNSGVEYFDIKELAEK